MQTIICVVPDHMSVSKMHVYFLHYSFSSDQMLKQHFPIILWLISDNINTGTSKDKNKIKMKNWQKINIPSYI